MLADEFASLSGFLCFAILKKEKPEIREAHLANQKAYTITKITSIIKKKDSKENSNIKISCIEASVKEKNRKDLIPR